MQPLHPPDPVTLDRIPVTYQAISEYFAQFQQANPFTLRKETFLRIERITSRPLICYVTKTHNIAQGLPAYIDDSDLTGFSDLIYSVDGPNLDVFLVSNGGIAEATERIVKLLRNKFESVRFIVPGNAYSAATMMCFSGDAIIMDVIGTLGPIDPQLNGVPAGAILDAFARVEEILKDQGPQALTAYMPLISKYDLHTFEMCRTAQDLSKELASQWLSSYMLQCPQDDPRIMELVAFFSDHRVHKSHARAIDRNKAQELLGDKVLRSEDVKAPGTREDAQGLGDLVRSLYNQYELWFDKVPFYKLFEDDRGVNWGRQAQTVTFQLSPAGQPLVPQPAPQPGPPTPTG